MKRLKNLCAIIAIMLIATLLSACAAGTKLVVLEHGEMSVPKHDKTKIKFNVPKHDKTKVKAEDIKISYYVDVQGPGGRRGLLLIKDLSKAPAGSFLLKITRYRFDLDNDGIPELVREEGVLGKKHEVAFIEVEVETKVEKELAKFANVFIDDDDNGGPADRVIYDRGNGGEYDAVYKNKDGFRTIEEIFLDRYLVKGKKM